MTTARRRSSIHINGRSLERDQPTGVDQLPALLALHGEAADLDVIVPRSTGRIASNLWEQVVLPLRAGRGTLVSLANSGPMVARCHVVMIHDLATFDHPEWFSRVYRLKTQAVFRTWARTSPLILSPSEFTAERIRSVLGVPSDRIVVVGNPHRWLTAPPSRRPASDRQAEPYVVAVSTLSTRKNLETIVAAWNRADPRLDGLRLKIVGAAGGPVLSGRSTTLDGDRIDYLGYVDDGDLDDILLGAEALVSASLYEGFNIPPLDALSLGVPVAASDIEVHRELYGDAASFFSTTDPASLVDAVVEALARPVADEVRADYGQRFAGAAVADRVLAAVASV